MNPRLDLSAHVETLIREVTEQILGLVAPVIREKVDEIVRTEMRLSFKRHTEEMGKHVNAVARVPGTEPYVAEPAKPARKTPELVMETVRKLPPEECTITRVISKICATGDYKENTVHKAISRLLNDGKLLRKGVEHLSLNPRR